MTTYRSMKHTSVPTLCRHPRVVLLPMWRKTLGSVFGRKVERRGKAFPTHAIGTCSRQRRCLTLRPNWMPQILSQRVYRRQPHLQHLGRGNANRAFANSRRKERLRKTWFFVGGQEAKIVKSPAGCASSCPSNARRDQAQRRHRLRKGGVGSDPSKVAACSLQCKAMQHYQQFDETSGVILPRRRLIS